MKVLVTGVSGFVGGMLAPALKEAGHEVVGLSRRPAALAGQVGFEVLKGDVAGGRGLAEALTGVDVAYYLVHSLETGNDEGYAERDRRAARNFAEAAKQAGVERVIYFGVPEPDEPELISPHFQSRLEVEQILMQELPKSTSLRSFVVLSARTPVYKFSLHLASQPHVALGPWRRYKTNPIDARDVTAGLVAALGTPDAIGARLDLMGPETVTHEELWRRTVRALGNDPEWVLLDGRIPEDLVRQMAEQAHTDPDFIAPLTESLSCGDITPDTDGAEVLSVQLHSLDEALEHLVAEYRSATTSS